MSLRVHSTAWITPLGRGADLAGTPNRGVRRNPFSGREFVCYEPRPADYADAARLPRLRRSSAISHLAVSVARAAAGETDASQWGLVFASADGGIVYTRRFFEPVDARNPGAGSPLLFPETVYNAPASHIAAALGITGTVLTVAGDADAGRRALEAAEQLLRGGLCETCLVVAAQEVDWIMCEAQAAWGDRAIPAEGAAALVVSREGGLPLPEHPADVSLLGECRGVSPLWGLIHGLRLTSPASRR
ncbi:MAG TPA: beta-ketoacyl synthase chain length factor [Chthoniobacterales bacterium]